MSRRLPVILTSAEIAALLNAARSAADAARTPTKQLAAWRDFIMIETGMRAGPRIAELCSLQVPDIDLVGAVLMIRRGKGDRDRNVPIGAKLLRMLREWIGERREGWVFSGPHGKKLSPRTFQLRLEQLAKAAGIHRRKAHPHVLRHCFACALLHTGSDIREVQELLGHTNLVTTAIYLHVQPEQLKAAVDRL